jgi:hypothetical protein
MARGGQVGAPGLLRAAFEDTRSIENGKNVLPPLVS